MGFILRSLNITIFVAFWLSFLRPGVPVVEYILDLPLAGNLPDSDAVLLHAFANFFVPAVLLYIVFRVTSIERWLKVSAATHTQLLIANALIVTLYFSSVSDPSLGLPLAIMYGIPAIIFSLTGTTTALFQMAANHQIANPEWRQPISGMEIKVVVVIGLAGSLFLGGPVFLPSDAGTHLVSKNLAWMKDNCPAAGTNVIRPFSGALFFEEAVNDYALRWSDSIDEKLSLKELLVQKIGVPQVEWMIIDPKKKTSEVRVYRKVGSEFKYESVDSITASYALRAKPIVEKEFMRSQHIYGIEFSIVESATDETIATLKAFKSLYPKLVCSDGYGPLDVTKFFREAFAK